MKKIYNQIWNLAKPYYEEGRPMDIDHIVWMMQDAYLVCQKEDLDDSLLLPLVILHDVGYSQVPKDNPFNLDSRKSHMKAGARIARHVLEKLDYPKKKIENIEYNVSVHDNWALGDNSVYEDNLTLSVFTDLDYIWMATVKGFPALMKILNKTKKEMLEYLGTNKKPQLRPFSTKTTKDLYQEYLKNRREEIADHFNG